MAEKWIYQVKMDESGSRWEKCGEEGDSHEDIVTEARRSRLVEDLWQEKYKKKFLRISLRFVGLLPLPLPTMDYNQQEKWTEIFIDLFKRGFLDWAVEEIPDERRLQDEETVSQAIEERDQEGLDAESFKSAEPLLLEAIEEVAKNYKTFIKVLPYGVSYPGEKTSEGRSVFARRSQVKKWLSPEIEKGFVGKATLKSTLDTLNPFGKSSTIVSSFMWVTSLTNPATGIGTLFTIPAMNAMGAENAKEKLGFDLGELVKKDKKQVIMPLTFMSHIELELLQADIDKLWKELRIRVNIDQLEAASAFAHPAIPIGALLAEWGIGTVDPGLKDLGEIGFGAGEEILKHAIKTTRTSSKIPYVSSLIAGIEEWYFRWVSGYLFGLQLAIDKQLSEAKKEEEGKDTGWVHLKFLTWEDTNLSISVWRKYKELIADELPFSASAYEPNELKKLEEIYQSRIPDDSYEALRIVNEGLILTGKFSEESPYCDETESSKIGSTQSTNYIDDILTPFLGNPMWVLEFLRGWEYESVYDEYMEGYGISSDPDIIKPGLWEEREDWVKEQLDTFSDNLKLLAKGTLRSTIYGEPFINTEPHPFNPAMPEWLWDEYDYLYMEMLEEQEEFEGSDAGGFGVGPMATLPLLIFFALPPQDDTTSTQFAGSSSPNRLGSTPDFTPTPIAPMPSLSQPSIGKSGGGSGVGLGAYLLAPLKELAALSNKRQGVSPMPKRNRISKFTERLFQIPQMMLTASPSEPLFAAGGTAGNILGGLSEPQPAPQIVHRFERGSVQIHTQKIDAKTLGNAFVSFLQEQSRK